MQSHPFLAHYPYCPAHSPPKKLTVTDFGEACFCPGSQAGAWESLLTGRVPRAQRVPKLELGNQRPAGTSRCLPQDP